MYPALPLDDAAGKDYYIDGALWRLAYRRELRRFALKRVALDVPVAQVVERIASGELLWRLAEPFDPLTWDLPVETVQGHAALLGAIRRSPAFVAARDWQLVKRVDERLAECRAWLSRRALAAGEPPDTGEGEE